MARRYQDCQFADDSTCETCSLGNYDRDCRNNPVNAVAYYRIRADLSQQELGELLGIEKTPQTRVSEWERGKKRPGRKYLAKLAEILGCSVADLL